MKLSIAITHGSCKYAQYNIFDSVLAKLLISFGGTFNIRNTDPKRFVIHESTHSQLRKKNQEINSPCSKHCMLVVIPILELGQNHYYEFTCKHHHQVHNCFDYVPKLFGSTFHNRWLSCTNQRAMSYTVPFCNGESNTLQVSIVF